MRQVTGNTVVRCFTTQNPTGAADADSLPTGTLVINGVDDGATVNITRKALGSYSASVVLPTISNGDELEIRIEATVGGVAGKLNLFAGQGDNVPDVAAALFTTAVTESYAADGSAPTPTQALLLIQQSLHEFAISGTTRTVKKLDGSTTAAVFTLDDATNPTATTRSA